jgi:hypothetical protein
MRKNGKKIMFVNLTRLFMDSSRHLVLGMHGLVVSLFSLVSSCRRETLRCSTSTRMEL